MDLFVAAAITAGGQADFQRPFNMALVPLLGTAPFLILLTPVRREAITHVFVILLAVLITYAFLNIALHNSRALDWVAYEHCAANSIYRDMSVELQEECGHHINIADGAQNVFALIFGWIPAAGYVGFWELVWRICNRRAVARLGDRFQGKTFSNVVVGMMFLPPFAFFLLWVPFTVLHWIGVGLTFIAKGLGITP